MRPANSERPDVSPRLPVAAGFVISESMDSGQDSALSQSLFEGGRMAATTTTPVIPFDTAPAAPTPNDIADDHSLLKIDQELDFLMEQIEDEIEESGEASKEAWTASNCSARP